MLLIQGQVFIKTIDLAVKVENSDSLGDSSVSKWTFSTDIIDCFERLRGVKSQNAISTAIKQTKTKRGLICVVKGGSFWIWDKMKFQQWLIAPNHRFLFWKIIGQSQWHELYQLTLDFLRQVGLSLGNEKTQINFSTLN